MHTIRSSLKHIEESEQQESTTDTLIELTKEELLTVDEEAIAVSSLG